MLQDKIKKMARLIVRSGLNVKKGQLVVVNAHIEAVDLVRAVTQEAFSIGAKDVIVRYNDEIVNHEHYLHASDSCFEKIPEYQAMFYNETAKDGACYLSIIGTDPDLMRDVDPKKMAESSKNLRQKTKEYRERLDMMQAQWCIVAAPTKSWAKKVYPNMSEEDAYMTLWKDIFFVTRIDEKDPVENWEEHKKSFDKKMKVMNELHLEKMHYENSLGTDLTVELPKGYLFWGGGSHLLDEEGTYYFANMPTEELFSAPKRDGVNGHLVASMPLIHNGNKVDGFWFDFKNGKVVNYDAKEGKDVLKSILDTDGGASYLGEVALVPTGSPINQLNRIFYNTLIDENASCHFALGRAYNECIQGGLKMSEEQLLEKGLNVSFTHVDFMVGTPDLKITGVNSEGKEIPIFVNGKWSSLFD